MAVPADDYYWDDEEKFSNKSYWRYIIGLIGLFIVGFIIYWQVSLYTQPSNKPINTVRVLGEIEFTERQKIMENVSDYAGWGFFHVDVDAIRLQVENMPWVAKAKIKRIWPDALEVVVEEHKPLVRWNDDKLVVEDYSVISQTNMSAEGAEKWQARFASLPKIAGAEGRHALLLQRYADMDSMLRALDERIAVLEEDERRSLSLQLSSGIDVNLGRKHWMSRMTRLAQVYGHLIKPEIDRIVSIDLRYPNGFSIKYRPDQES